MASSSHAEPTAQDFPVSWDDPADAQLFWFQDNLHFPFPQTPLNATLFQTAFESGASAAIARLSMPISALRTSVQNGYVFLAPVPVHGEPEQLQQRFAEMQRITMELAPTVLQDWRETFEPQVLESADRILAFDYAGSSARDVAAFVQTFKSALAEVWDIHMRVNILPMNAVFGLEEFLGGVLGEDILPKARQLLQGFPNKSTELGQTLWALSRWVGEEDGLAEVALSARAHGPEIELGDHAAATEFHERFAAFLDTFGWRSDVFAEVGHPTWREDPSTPLTQLKDYIRLDDSADPFIAHRRQAEERAGLVAEMEAQLPATARPQFQGMLQMAQQFLPMSEDHNFTIDQKFSAVIRYGVLQLGEKLVADGASRRP